MDIYPYDFLPVLFFLFSSVVYIVGLAAIAKVAYNFYKKLTNKNMTAESKTNVSILSVFFSILLTIILLYFFSAIWSDLTRMVPSAYEVRNNPILMQEKAWSMPIKSSLSLSDSMANQLNILVWHILFVLPLVISSSLLYIELKKKGSKYNILAIPFLVASLLMLLRLLADVGSFITGEYQRLGTYLVIIILIIIVGGLAFWSQAKKEESSK